MGVDPPRAARRLADARTADWRIDGERSEQQTLMVRSLTTGSELSVGRQGQRTGGARQTTGPHAIDDTRSVPERQGGGRLHHRAM